VAAHERPDSKGIPFTLFHQVLVDSWGDTEPDPAVLRENPASGEILDETFGAKVRVEVGGGSISTRLTDGLEAT